MVFMQRFVKVTEPMCRDCGTQLLRQFTTRTLVQGWWGYISFFVNWFVLAANGMAYRELAQLPMVHVEALRQSQEPKRTVAWRTCPACGANSAVAEEPSWACHHCLANGLVIRGVMVDFGLAGQPRGGEWTRHTPQHPVYLQLASVEPALGAAAPDDELVERFGHAAFTWFYEFAATPFDIDDVDVEAAEATGMRNLAGDPNMRADDKRFYALTAFSTGGWQWRRAEEAVGLSGQVDETTAQWVGRYRGTGDRHTRSEVIGLVATMISDETTLERRSTSEGILRGAFLFPEAMFLGSSSPVASLHPHELCWHAFRFGVSLRDAQVAYDDHHL